MKLALFAVGAFVVALAAGTGISVMTAPKPQPLPAVADSLLAAPDSSHATPGAAHGATDPAHAAADTAHAAPAKPDPMSVTHAAPPASAAPANAAPAKPATPGPAPVSAPAIALASAPESDAGYKQVARVLSNMKPADAAAIVAHLSDDQLDGVLRQLGVRQAASLLGALPVERAAAMSRRMIRQPPKTEAR